MPKGNMGRFKRMPIAERMALQTQRATGDFCWPWTGAIHHSGYGHVHYQGRHQLAHRVAYEVANGPVPDGMQVLHRCDNRRCVNPGHLFLGTHQDNMDDMAAKGRANGPRGERHHWARLTEEQVVEVRRSSERGIDIAARLGVRDTTISMIRTGRNWKRLQA